MPESHEDDSEAGAPGFASGDDPFALFESWFETAKRSEPADPNAMALATVDRDGLPNVRMVLLKGLDGAGVSTQRRGFVFYTNLESAKGQELAVTPKAALCFHWKSIERQVRARGALSAVSNEEADAYFASRPRLSRIGAWASQQSRPLETRLELEREVARMSARYAVGEIPRPPYWSGFRLVPVEIEFWKSRPFRLHEREVFRRQRPEAAWEKSRLFP